MARRWVRWGEGRAGGARRTAPGPIVREAVRSATLDNARPVREGISNLPITERFRNCVFARGAVSLIRENRQVESCKRQAGWIGPIADVTCRGSPLE